ncbi:MAG TPA: fumarylacetoacetate hydrolase family protein [Baekduia sp.]|nr:fumarylacetoacetate hydrolase family protein [Baekduia sp.]
MPVPPSPSKILAIHLNFRSRAEERGRIPANPSYFLKPPSSLQPGGGKIVRPEGFELLVYEGEIALIIGTTARNVTPEEGWSHVSHVAPVNDWGVYDMRHADRGSNVMAKGQDGFTPIGDLVAASEVDPEALTIRTRVNGEIVQEGTSDTLLFPFGQLIADISRFMTLQPGDMILTGTPAHSRPAEPGDIVEVELEGHGSVRSEVISGPPLASYGAQPKVSPAVRADALGIPTPRPVTLSDDAKAALRTVSTATITVQLKKRGIRNTFLAGLKPTRPDERLLGYAHTLRYVALREDILAADKAPLNAQKAAIESLEQDEVLVIEARGESGAGTIGDILAMRAIRLGATGIVTDGGVRDSQTVAGLEIPTYFQNPHAATLGLLHFPLESQVPITCAGVLVMPGDVMVGDGDGVLVIPAAMAEEIAFEALEQEEREIWGFERVAAGDGVLGVFPIGPERKAEYEQWRDARRGKES